MMANTAVVVHSRPQTAADAGFMNLYSYGAHEQPDATSGDEGSVTGSEDDYHPSGMPQVHPAALAAYMAQFNQPAQSPTPSNFSSSKRPSTSTTSNLRSSKRHTSYTPETHTLESSSSHHQTEGAPTPLSQAARRANRTSTKRAEQNRAAQRAFRERRQRYIKDLELRSQAADALSAQLLDTTARLAELQHALDALMADRDAWTREREVWWRERDEAVTVAESLARDLEECQRENKRLKDAVWGLWNGEKDGGDLGDLFETKLVKDLTRDVVVADEELAGNAQGGGDNATGHLSPDGSEDDRGTRDHANGGSQKGLSGTGPAQKGASATVGYREPGGMVGSIPLSSSRPGSGTLDVRVTNYNKEASLQKSDMALPMGRLASAGNHGDAAYETE
ncbi:hypothetical protein HK097_010714 [Rhizophlyctis rosea]|uniref:BZIP domain-containing protein n=1 Tax=Rhizophlyctis rosea TaxID=64517 RepID=A0AAD5SK71_9FUNG|nr:hypothetical protein HK097_010714 [Rhizophlyctis rosea]